MITSFIQYLLMAPSYIAVLNVYAVRQHHDAIPSVSNSPPSSPMCTMYRGAQKVTTKSSILISVWSPRGRTKTKSKLRFPPLRMTSTPLMRTPYKYSPPSHRRRNRSQMQRHNRRITTGLLGRTYCSHGRYLTCVFAPRVLSACC